MNQENPGEMSRPAGEIIPPAMAIKSMRDSGYKNTAYALAELIDNSVQANAKDVEVICIEAREQINQRSRRRIRAIGILDNGEGMTPEVLRLALQFGNGTHLNDRKGIGRFGMGLPNSSISQCRRLDVWTWQNGPDNAMHTYLDVDKIERRVMAEIPEPAHTPLPDKWRNRSQIIGTTGTLVLWKNFDDYRLTWRGALATLRNTELLIGRMYRKFIDEGRLSIRLCALLKGENGSTFDEFVRVNDPLYLMDNSSTPKPFDTKPMFQHWGDYEDSIEYRKISHKVVVRVSYALPETVPTDDNSDRGGKPYGKHAAKNIGLSIIREGRELDLDSGWANSYDPIERWWGVEIEFPSTLDELFDVANTKQAATRFSDLASFGWETEAYPGESERDVLKRLKEEGDPRALLLPIAKNIKTQIGEVRKKLKKQTEGRRTTPNKRGDKAAVDDTATKKFRDRAEQGPRIDADKTEFTQEDSDKLREDLKKDHEYPPRIADEIADATLVRKRKVVFLTKAMDGYAFFNVEHKQGGLTAIVFNTNHKFYERLMETLDPKIGDESSADLLARIYEAADNLELLFAAWARYNMEEVHRQEFLSEVRQEWGKMANFFLSNQDND